VEFALEHAARFGFDPDKLPGNLSLALGSGEVTPMQMARGYSVLANGGYLIEPHVIERIEDTRDGVLFQAEPATICSRCPDEPPTELTNGEMTAEAATDTDEAEPATIEAATADMDDTDSTPRHAPRVLNARNQYLMTSMMKDVIQRGTGVRAKTLGRKDLAGKTGTTNDQRDSWFNGFNRSLVASVWVGLDSYKPLGRGEVGGKAALPAWIDFMRTALDGVPEQSWDMPDDIVTVRIDPETGQRAPTGDKNAIFEVFRKENEPAKSATDRSGTAVAGGTGRSSETLTQELF